MFYKGPEILEKVSKSIEEGKPLETLIVYLAQTDNIKTLFKENVQNDLHKVIGTYHQIIMIENEDIKAKLKALEFYTPEKPQNLENKDLHLACQAFIQSFGEEILKKCCDCSSQGLID